MKSKKPRWLAWRHVLVVWFVLVLAIVPSPVQADIAPPDFPPGANVVPGSEATQVRMVAETVTLAVQRASSSNAPGQVITTCDFTMRNLGAETERMEVRFPLTFLYGQSNGWGEFPEIRDLRVRVNGGSVSTRRVTTPAPDDVYADRETVPWAAFDVTFPPGEDVKIQVIYTGDGIGEYPYVGFRYILETGAGWKDTIGSVDVIVHYPFEVNPYNVLMTETTGFSETSPGATLSGQEIHWHTDDLEPTWEDNIRISLVMPEAWQKVEQERQNVAQNPNDGEAWGRLGKAYKEISLLRKGFREDAGGQALIGLSIEAYEKAVTLKPNDALWHFGFADMLFSHYYWNVAMYGTPDHTTLVRAVEQLKAALELDPDNDRALELMEIIAGSFPGVVQAEEGGGYDYLILTATPTFAPTRTSWVTATVTPLPEPSATPIETQAATIAPTATETAVPAIVEPAQAPAQTGQVPASNEKKGGLPVCGAALLPAALLGVFTLRRRRAG